MRTTGSPAEVEERHWLAVQALLRGYTAEEVADVLDVDIRSVQRWRRAFRKQGLEGLAAAPVPGRPSKLTHTQEKIVLRWLRESPSEHGFGTELWTGGRLAWLIERVLGVHFHPHYLNTWVRRRDVTPQKPQRQAREADPKAIAAWVGKDWPRIQKKALRQGACIAFIDESGLLMAPLVRRSLAPRGHPSVLLEKAAPHEKVSVAASLWLAPGLNRLGLCFQTLPNDYFDNQYSALFLEALVQELGGLVTVV